VKKRTRRQRGKRKRQAPERNRQTSAAPRTQTPKAPSAPRRRRPWYVAAVIAIVAFPLGAVQGGLVTPKDVDWAWRYARDVWEPGPVAEQRVITRYLDEARKSGWVGPFALWESSDAYFRSHYRELNPREPHLYPDDPAERPVDLDTLVTNAPALASGQVVTSGFTSRPQIVEVIGAEPPLPPVASYALTLSRPGSPRAVLCRVPKFAPPPISEGERVRVRGLILGTGMARTSRGRAIATAYMICTSAVSVNLLREYRRSKRSSP
jgi:hypothetical protein